MSIILTELKVPHKIVIDNWHNDYTSYKKAIKNKEKNSYNLSFSHVMINIPEIGTFDGHSFSMTPSKNFKGNIKDFKYCLLNGTWNPTFFRGKGKIKKYNVLSNT